MKVSTLCFAFLAVLVVVQSQFTERRVTGTTAVGDCPVPDATLIAALLPESFGLGDGAPRPTVTVSDFTIVCQSPGLVRNTISSFSVIVSFSCTSGPAVCDGSLLTNQFQYDCNSDNTFTMAQVGRGSVQTTNPTGTLMTPLNEQCGECVDPTNGAVSSNVIDHCAACLQVCNQGQQGCVGVSLRAESCCNWYMDERCVVSCPGNLTGDTEPGTIYDCGCGPLQLEFGEISYSDRFTDGSIANHTCNGTLGYVLPEGSDNQRVCNMTTPGWTGETITCNLHDCGSEGITDPENGQVNMTNTTFNSVANFSCVDGYNLVGNEQRTCQLEGWSGSNPTCSIHDCGTEGITAPENGRVDITSTVFGSMANFSCGDGYNLVGNEQRTCQLEGWTGTNPTCSIHDCGSEGITDLDNGQVDMTSTTFGSVTTFTCIDGYNLVGNEQRICQLDGWNGNNPTCELADTSSVDTTGIAVGVTVAVVAILVITAIATVTAVWWKKSRH